MTKLLILLLSFFLAVIASASDFGPDVLSDIGAKQTCIESTSYPGKRCFYTYIPECAGQDAPLVFDIHGYGASPFVSSLYTGWISKANENCFVLVMPSGNIEMPATIGEDNSCWAMPAGLTNANGTDALPCCCLSVWGFTDADFTDDTTFLRNVAVSAIQTVVPAESANAVSIDSKRIYMAGHSNGCISSIAMGTVHSDLVAGVCCHSGMAQASIPSSYQPTPMWIAHGTLDQVIYYNGLDQIEEFPQYSALGAQATHGVLSEANGCTESKIMNVEESDNTITRYISDGCVNGKTVELFAIHNVGHVPYLGAELISPIENGTVPTNVDTTQLAWDFCSQYSLDVEPELILVTPDSPDNDDSPDILSHASIVYHGTASKAMQLGLFAIVTWWFVHS